MKQKNASFLIFFLIRKCAEYNARGASKSARRQSQTGAQCQVEKFYGRKGSREYTQCTARGR